MKKIFVILVIIVIGYAVYRISRLSPNTGQSADLFKKPADVKKTMATLIPQQSANFIKDGVIVQKEENEETAWKFIYEEPGAPVLQVMLDFNNRSRCDYGQGEQICNKKKFENGLRVHVEGNKNGDQLKVIRLKVLNN